MIKITYLLTYKFRLNYDDIEEEFSDKETAINRYNALLENREEQLIDYMDLYKITEIEKEGETINVIDTCGNNSIKIEESIRDFYS